MNTPALESSRGVDAGYRRAHQQRRPVAKSFGQPLQGPATPFGEILGAKVLAGSGATESQLRRDAEIRPGGGRLTGSLKNAREIAGHVAGHAVTLQ